MTGHFITKSALIKGEKEREGIFSETKTNCF